MGQEKITRREFFERISALGITTALSPTLFLTTSQAKVPKRGGQLRIGLADGVQAHSLDPATFNDVMMEMTSMGLLRNCLVEIDYKGNVIPELAKSWELTPDAKHWTFNIRKGVEFHNGKTLDAEDVIFSINHHRKSLKSAIKFRLSIIKKIKKVSKYAVTFHLNNPSVDFHFLMGSSLLPIVPDGTTNFEKGTGTGGYKLVKFEPGVSLFATRNPYYWKEGRAHFDEIYITVIPDVKSRIYALKSGEFNLVNRVDIRSADLLRKEPGIKLLNVTGPSHYTMPMLTDTPPYNNNDVRLALKYAIDRRDILNKIFRGYGVLGNDHPISPAYRYYASELPQREYDPDRARFHLKKAGLVGFTFKLHASDAAFTGAIDTTTLYREHAARAGINIQVVREPYDGYWSNVWMKKPWVTSYWYGYLTEDWMFSTAYAAGAKWNDSHWVNARFNELLKEARSVIDIARRREIYVEMQRIVRDLGGSIIPLFRDIIDAASENLKYDNIAPNRELNGLRAPERMWHCPPGGC